MICSLSKATMELVKHAQNSFQAREQLYMLLMVTSFMNYLYGQFP